MAHGQSVQSVDDTFRAYMPVEVSSEQWLSVPPEEYMGNPGYLKLDLMTRGVRVSSELLESLFIRPRKDSAWGVGSGIDLLLPEEVWVNAPVREDFVCTSPYALERTNDKWILRREGCASGGNHPQVAVDVPPKPTFFSRETSKGRLMGELAHVQGGYLIMGPRYAHDFWQTRLDSGDAPLEAGLSPATIGGGEDPVQISVDEMLEVLEAALREGASDHLVLNVGLTDQPDGGIQLLKPYIGAIKKHFDVLIRVNAHPPRDEEWVDWSYALGIDSVAYNLEVFDIRTYQQVAPGRARRIRRDQYLERLARAARIFPNGAVMSHLILGLEPIGTTLAGIRALSELGVLPTLSVFRPLLGTGIENWPPMEIEQFAPVAAYLFHAVRENRVSMTWGRSISNAITPIEGRFFTRDGAGPEVRRQNFFKTKTGYVVAKNLANLRRALRVKTVSESFDSAGL